MSDYYAFRRLWRDLGKVVWNHTQASTHDSHSKGKQWEGEFFEMCKSRGFCVEASQGREDGIVSGLKVQCKSIDRVHNGWIDIANMRPVKANGGKRGYLRSEVCVVALRHQGSVFLIPADWLSCDDGTIRGRVRSADIHRFHDNWCVFDNDYQPPPIDRQLPLL